MKRQISAMIFVAAAMLSATVHATTYYWADVTGKRVSDGNLGTPSNWLSSSGGTGSSPAEVSAANDFTIQLKAALPGETDHWSLSGDVTMGTFTTTKSASSTVGPKECVVDLHGYTLTVAYLVSRGIMVFTNGTVTATATGDSKYNCQCGNTSNPNNCQLTFSGAGTTFTHPTSMAITLCSGTNKDASNNRLAVLDGAQIHAGTVNLTGSQALTGIQTNNMFIVSGEGSSAELDWLVYGFGSASVARIEDGATLSVGNNVNIGTRDGSVGNVLCVTGRGSTLDVGSKYVRLGNAAGSDDNRLVVEGGACLTANALNVGAASGSTNNVATITGSGSAAVIPGSTYVGGNLQADANGNRLEVLDGATYSAYIIYLGDKGDNNELFVSNATVTISEALKMGGQNALSGDKFGGVNSVLHVAGASTLVSNALNIEIYTSQKMVFDIPEAGWATAPVQITGRDKTINFRDTGSAALSVTVNARGTAPGRYVLVSAKGDIDFSKISLSADSSANVELDTSNTSELAVRVKQPGLAILFR